MKSKWKVGLGIGIAFVAITLYLNHKYEVFAFHPFFGSDKADLKVMTWNIHCSQGADSTRQQRIAELVLQENADFVQLNEFFQDNCRLLDSLLRTRYQFAEEFQSHKVSGDIFYSKKEMINSGHVWIPIDGKSIQTLKATIGLDADSIQIYGVHLASNSADGSAIVNGLDSLKKIGAFYERYKKVQEERCFQAHWTKVYAQESPHPLIVMGDMNDFSASAPLDTFESIGLKNAWWEGGTGYGCTFHTGWMRLRIDHIMYSDSLELMDVKVIPTDLSDHNPVVASFKIKK